MTPFAYHIDGSSRPVPAYPISDTVFRRALTANTPVTVTVPADAKLAAFNSTVSFFLKEGASVAVPTADADDAPEFDPIMRQVKAGSQISVISAEAGEMFISFYS